MGCSWSSRVQLGADARPERANRLMGSIARIFIEIDRSFQREMGRRPGLDGMRRTLTVLFGRLAGVRRPRSATRASTAIVAARLEQLTRDHTVPNRWRLGADFGDELPATPSGTC